MDYIQLVILSGLLLSIIYVMALTYLIERFSYFICIFIPSAFPAVLSQVLYFEKIPTIYSIIFTIWFSVIFISAFMTNRLHNRLNILNLKNMALIQQSQNHLNESSILQVQLKDEITKSQEIKNELLLHNQLLEQKVKERTFDFKQINEKIS